jgi:hypothetical protein
VRAALVGILLVVAVFSQGEAGHSLSKGGGKLCVATEFPTGSDEPDRGAWGRSLEHAVDLAVQQHESLGNGYTLSVLPYREVSPDTATRDPSQGAHNVLDMLRTPCLVGVVGPTWSPVATVEMPLTAKAGLVMISPATTMPGLTLRLYAQTYSVDFDQLHPPGAKTNYFRDVANDAFQGLELAAFTSRLPPGGWGRGALLSSQTITPRTATCWPAGLSSGT